MGTKIIGKEGKMAKKLEAQGGRGGEVWDDGGAYENVKKVYVGQGDSGVVYVKFDYEKDGKIVSREHGKKTLLGTEEFVFDPEDHITSVKVYYEKLFGSPTEIVTALIFKTFKGKTSQPFGLVSGQEAELGGGKIVGFHGSSSDLIHSLGAYIIPSTTPVTPPVSGGPTKLEAQGGRGGDVWDDGGAYDNVKKVYVGQGDSGVVYVKFDYEKDGKIVSVEHGKQTLLGTEEFEIDPEDYITSVKVYYEKLFGSPTEIITSLVFKTFKGKTSQPFGLTSGDTAELGGGKIVGFHGTSSNLIHSLGAYIIPSTTPVTPPVSGGPTKLEAQGGRGGNVWDDGGAYDNVKKVYVGRGDSGVVYVKFDYEKDGKIASVEHGKQRLLGTEEVHGKKTLLGVDEFEIDVDDYIVYVEGYREKVNDITTETITFLSFKTYKGKSSQPIERRPGTKFVLHGGKIVGFHGRSTDVLHSLGAYVSSPSAPKLLGKWIKVEQKGEGPGLRCSHGIAQVGNNIYAFGGEFTPNQHIDKHLYVFDIETRTWSISPATGDVPHLSCLGVRMVSVGSTLYVFGGRDASRQYNGFYSFDTTKNEWKLVTPVEEGPTPRSFHSMAADENNVYVFGGVSATERLKTLDAYNIVVKKWVQCSTPGDSCSIRGGAGLEVVQGKVWVVYGFNGYEVDDVHYYDPVQDKWTQVETFGERPSERSVFASAAAGKHIMMFGGEIDMDPLAHVGPGQLTDGTFALDTETLKWERLDKFGEEEETPSARGWSASTTGTIDGKKGLVMHGGKAPTNDRFDDLFFYGIESA